MSFLRKTARSLGIEYWQAVAVLLMLYDAVAMAGSYILALWVRYDGSFRSIARVYLDAYAEVIIPYIVVSLAMFWFLKMYKGMWRFASLDILIRSIISSLAASVLHTVAITLVCRMPMSYYFLGALFQCLMVTGIRFAYRFVQYIRAIRKLHGAERSRVMLIGAGAAGQVILRELASARESTDQVVCVIDDNPNKWGRDFIGVPVVGGRDEIMNAVSKYRVEKIYLAIPSASMQVKRDILAICNETGCELKQLPGMYQLVSGQVSVSQMKDVSVEDLLGREPVKANMEEVYSFINGKTVMVTGGGGSIGSELCRQIAAHHPKQLIIFEIYENNAYDIQMELKKKHPELDLVVLIGSVRDSRRVFQVFETYRPQIVYHAAAHKHVPLMEDSPCESIKNNTMGTYKTAYAAMVHGCERFVLISTDKAVNPTNIMGASKRLCEMIIQSFDKKIKEKKANEIPQLFTHTGFENADKDGTGEVWKYVHTEFVAVRFGNVLGSNGSVIPLFKKQIEAGGPVTVTHPDIIRYFMTIPEAVSLVMLAGTYAKGGEIFVLDMGSPVKIESLARNLIRQSGFKPDEDIKIVYTGLRPGEKLYEEKLMAEEGLQKTANKLIHIGRPIPFEENVFLKKLGLLMDAAYNNQKNIRALVAGIVNSYHPEGVEPQAINGESVKRKITEPDQ